MEETQKAVLGVLLDILHEQDLVDSYTHDRAYSLLCSATTIPGFFCCPVRCQGKEDKGDGCSQDAY